MYQSHWGLRESPFHEAVDPQVFYQSPTHEEALARLHFLVEQHRRLGLLLGPEGSGKSLLLEILAAELRRHGPVVARVNLTGISGDEMLWSLAAQFGRNLDRCDSDAGALAGAQRPPGRLPLSTGRHRDPRRRRRPGGEFASCRTWSAWPSSNPGRNHG